MTVVKNVLNRIHVQRLLFAAALFGLSLSANAAFPRVTQTSAGKTTTISAGGSNSGGSALADVIAKNPMSRSDGGVAVGASGKANVSGVAVPVVVSGVVAKDALAGAVSGAIAGARGGLVGAAAGAAVGAALPLAMNWASQNGMALNPQTGEIERPDVDPSWPTSDGYLWIAQRTPLTFTGYGPEDACSKLAPAVAASFNQTLTGHALVGTTCQIFTKKADGSADYWAGGVAKQGASNCPSGWYVTPAGCVSAANLPRIVMTGQQIADKLASGSPNPAPGVANEVDQAGSPAPVKDVTVTGPSAIAGPTTTITNNIDNSVKTTTVTNNYNYNGSNVTNTGTTTKTQTTKADGTKTEDTTSTVAPGDTEPAKPDDPKVQCDKYPNSLGCAELDTPDAEIPKDTKTVGFTAEDPFGSGRCPADVMARFGAIGGQSLKIVDWTTFCSMALPLRGLVLGLASIMAFFIIMPGGVRE